MRHLKWVPQKLSILIEVSQRKVTPQSLIFFRWFDLKLALAEAGGAGAFPLSFGSPHSYLPPKTFIVNVWTFTIRHLTVKMN